MSRKSGDSIPIFFDCIYDSVDLMPLLIPNLIGNPGLIFYIIVITGFPIKLGMRISGHFSSYGTKSTESYITKNIDKK